MNDQNDDDADVPTTPVPPVSDPGGTKAVPSGMHADLRMHRIDAAVLYSLQITLGNGKKVRAALPRSTAQEIFEAAGFEEKDIQHMEGLLPTKTDPEGVGIGDFSDWAPYKPESV